MRIFSLVILTVAFFVQSCQNEGAKPCTETKSASAILGEFPDTLKVGTKYDLAISYVLESSCGEFDYFDVNYSQKTYNIKLMTKYEGCSCKIALEEKTINYEIDVDFPGTYEFRFWLADGDYESRLLSVVE
jgi:hypothetical protein